MRECWELFFTIPTQRVTVTGMILIDLQNKVMNNSSYSWIEMNGRKKVLMLRLNDEVHYLKKKGLKGKANKMEKTLDDVW